MPSRPDTSDLFAAIENFVPRSDVRSLGCEDRLCIIENFDAHDLVTLADGIDHILALAGLTEDGMLAIEVRGGSVGDEELAAIGPGTGIGHGKDSGLVVAEVALALILKGISWAAPAGSRGIAALHHEVGNDAMEGDSVVVAPARQIQETGTGDRGIGGVKGDVNIALGGFHDDANGVHSSRP